MKLTRRLVVRFFLFTILAAALAIIGLAASIAPRIRSKEDAPHADQEALLGQLHEAFPEAQFESDTCGLHTLRAIYKSYGIDPNRENLRVRLGVDVPAVPTDETSTGTLQPDMLRVLSQDRFAWELLDVDHDAAAEELVQHLLTANMAAVLIRRRENGHLHWVAASSIKSGKMAIVDSLRDHVYFEEPRSFLGDCILSCILVRPSSEETEVSLLSRAHADGTTEMMRTLRRYREKAAGKAN